MARAQVFVDRVSLQTTETTSHLLDPLFEGASHRRAPNMHAPGTCMRTRVHACTSSHGCPARVRAGAFSAADLELKGEIQQLVAELNADPLARDAEAYEEVRAMLAALGDPAALGEPQLAPTTLTTEAPAEPAGPREASLAEDLQLLAEALQAPPTGNQDERGDYLI